MEEKHSFKKLTEWNNPYLFVLNIYKQTQSFPSSELYGLTSQISRGVISILANIAEGSERQHKRNLCSLYPLREVLSQKWRPI